MAKKKYNKNDTTNKLIAALDIGKYDGKGIGIFTPKGSIIPKEDLQKCKTEISIRTKLTTLSDDDVCIVPNADSGSYILEADGKKYMVGKDGKDFATNTSRKSIPHHRFNAMCMIAELSKGGKKAFDVYLVVAAPLLTLDSKKARDEYANVIRGGKTADELITINVNEKEFNFYIRDIAFMPEGCGPIYLNPELFANSATLLLDIGGLNDGEYLYMDKSLSVKNMGNSGTFKLENDVCAALTQHNYPGDLLQMDMVSAALRREYYKSANKKADKKVIQAAKQKFLDEIFNSLSTIMPTPIDIETVDKVVLVGGTSHMLKTQLANIAKRPEYNGIKFVTTLEPHKSTVKVLYMAACSKFNKKY